MKMCCLLLCGLMSLSLMTSSTLSAQPKTALQKEQSISRVAFQKVYQAGLQKIIASVRIKPMMKGRKFIGFELAQVIQGSLIDKAGFKVGDVIVKVNDEPIGRPEQMMRVWALLEYAPYLSVEFERLGTYHKKSWKIITQ